MSPRERCDEIMRLIDDVIESSEDEGRPAGSAAGPTGAQDAALDR